MGPSVFFWVGLSAYMIIWNAAPFHFRVVDWMILAICITLCRYVMQQRMRSVGNCDEMSIWRSQQMFFVGGPLHVMSLCQGTKAAFKIWAEDIDKSFWSASDHGVQVVTFVKLWTGAVLGACVLCTAILVGVSLVGGTVGSTQWVALILLLVMGFTIMSPVTDIWGGTDLVTRWRREEVEFPPCSCRCSSRSYEADGDESPRKKRNKRQWCSQLARWSRSKLFRFFY